MPLLDFISERGEGSIVLEPHWTAQRPNFANTSFFENSYMEFVLKYKLLLIERQTGMRQSPTSLSQTISVQIIASKRFCTEPVRVLHVFFNGHTWLSCELKAPSSIKLTSFESETAALNMEIGTLCWWNHAVKFILCW